jgi:hypothetical protein
MMNKMLPILLAALCVVGIYLFGVGLIWLCANYGEELFLSLIFGLSVSGEVVCV